MTDQELIEYARKESRERCEWRIKNKTPAQAAYIESGHWEHDVNSIFMALSFAQQKGEGLSVEKVASLMSIYRGCERRAGR